ncbi:tyrosine-type recombinase/integrase, partial [Desulfovibrio desulfuricans]|uniref:tyrosine-type recombinase/integrase n=1 Tax=Desulfovibrio desulfuricans TaxID=876 RepID=UPI001D067CDE
HDIERLLDSFGEDERSLYQKAILELLYGCGLRVSEVCELRLNQVHLEQGYLRVIGKVDKERMVPMHKRCVL